MAKTVYFICWQPEAFFLMVTVETIKQHTELSSEYRGRFESQFDGTCRSFLLGSMLIYFSNCALGNIIEQML